MDRSRITYAPRNPGWKRICVRVDSPFVPAAEAGGRDRRQLGIFIHALVPQPWHPTAVER